jgi:hypothetical protein
MDSRYFDMFDTPSSVIGVDLDTNSMSLSEDCKNMNSRNLPKKAVNVLKSRLNILANELTFLTNRKRDLNRIGTTTIKEELEIKRRERECVKSRYEKHF